jgi:hypothetical protein
MIQLENRWVDLDETCHGRVPLECTLESYSPAGWAEPPTEILRTLWGGAPIQSDSPYGAQPSGWSGGLGLG